MNNYESRRKARENGARALLEHERKLGRDPSFESCQRRMNERADICDVKKDRGYKKDEH